MTHLDLFSGIGGFSIAAQWVGFQTIGFSEIEMYCCQLLVGRFPDIAKYGDIRTVEVLIKRWRNRYAKEE